MSEVVLDVKGRRVGSVHFDYTDLGNDRFLRSGVRVVMTLSANGPTLLTETRLENVVFSAGGKN